MLIILGNIATHGYILSSWQLSVLDMVIISRHFQEAGQSVLGMRVKCSQDNNFVHVIETLSTLCDWVKGRSISVSYIYNYISDGKACRWL